MLRGVAVIGVMAMAVVLACGRRADSPAADGIAKANPLASSVWDDGRAEFSTYAGLTERYGHARPTTATLIVVKEDLDRTTLVKSDAVPSPGRTITAIKLNWIADFNTGTYDYHQMATVMFDRESGRALKETMSHSEGCGMTFVRVGPKRGRLVHDAHSYWDGEADREVTVKPGPGELVFADGLPVWLRRWAGSTRPFVTRVRLLPSQVSGRSPIEATQPVEATVRFEGLESFRTADTTGMAARFTVESPAETSQFRFDVNPPHPMVLWRSSKGRELMLVRTQRLAYWELTAPEHAKLVR